jgi:hypothetical protein
MKTEAGHRPASVFGVPSMTRDLEVQVLCARGVAERSVEQSRAPTNRNRIQGVVGQGERAEGREAVVRAGEQVMAALERIYAKLRLRVNRERSKVELAHKCSLLSYSFWYSKGGAVICLLAPAAARALKPRVRRIIGRSGGRSLKTVVAELKKYLPGWKEYFQLADTPRVFADDDKWIRHRLRALQLKQWKRGPGSTPSCANSAYPTLPRHASAANRRPLVAQCSQVGADRSHHSPLR